jgi:hypothetical protein
MASYELDKDASGDLRASSYFIARKLELAEPLTDYSHLCDCLCDFDVSCCERSCVCALVMHNFSDVRPLKCEALLL